MGGGGGGGAPAHTFSEIRYNPYIENKHSDFLIEAQAQRKTAVENNPFSNYVNISVDEAFFGVGYAISSFPSLYDVYGKFMAGLDVEALYSQTFESVVESPHVNALISAEAALMDDEMETTSIPRLELGARDLNSAMSSTFIIGRSIIESAKTKAMSRFSAQLKYNLISTAQEVWKAHLEWNRGVVGMYSEIMKFFFSAKTDVDEINYSMGAKKSLWAFTVLDFERACLGALQGATTQRTDVAGASTASKVLSGALSGAAMGASIGSMIKPATAATATTAASAGGGAMGAGIGAVLGIGAALTY